MSVCPSLCSSCEGLSSFCFCAVTPKYYPISFKFATVIAPMTILDGIAFGVCVCPSEYMSDFKHLENLHALVLTVIVYL